MDLVIEQCVDRAIDVQCAKIVNEYIMFYNSKLEDYELKHLDYIYYYLLHSHNSNIIDIFDYNDTLYSYLFLV